MWSLSSSWTRSVVEVSGEVGGESQREEIVSLEVHGEDGTRKTEGGVSVKEEYDEKSTG